MKILDSTLLFLVSLVLGGIGAGIVAIYGYRLGLIDNPNGRSSHQHPTPKGGGIGILSAFILASLYLRIPLTFWIPVIDNRHTTDLPDGIRGTDRLAISAAGACVGVDLYGKIHDPYPL